MDSFEMAREWKGLGPAEQVDRWHKIMDEHDIERAICFPTGSGNIAKNQEVPFQIAVARASNTHFAKEYNARSNRVFCVGALPMRSPQAAADELRRSVNEFGFKGFEILPTGLPLALGDPFYDPIYTEAERLGVVLGVHGTRNTSRNWAPRRFRLFRKFTLMHSPQASCCSSPALFARDCRSVSLNSNWPFWKSARPGYRIISDRLDEHWEKRAAVEMPLLKQKPSDMVRESKMYFSVEPGESQLAATVDYIGAEHFLYASDIPHWDNEFPGNLKHLRSLKEWSDEAKQKILYKNAKELFSL